VLVIALIVAAFAVVFTLVGAPLSLLTRRSEDGWLATIGDGILYGLLIVTVGVTLYSWLGGVGAVIAIAGLVATVVFAIRRGELPQRSVGPSTRARRILIAAWILLFVVALLLRLHSVNFLPWVGDMGAYVNWANAWHVRDYFVSSWPPLFGVFLSISSFFFGTANTTAAVGVSGLLLLVAIARLLQRLGVAPWVTFALTALLAVHQHAVWYSTFPSSESLNLPIFVTWALLLHASLTSERRIHPWLLAAFGLSTFALALLRGSGALLLVPLALIVVLAIIVPEWRRLSGRLSLVFATGVVGAGLGYWYGVSVIPRYFVQMQIKGLLPESISSIVDAAGFFDPTPQLVAALVLLPLALAALAHVLDRRWADSTAEPTRWSTIVPLALAAALVLGVIATAVVGAMTFSILLRLGPWLIVGSIAAFALPVYRRLPAAQQMIAVLLMASNIMFIALHTLRLGFDRGHSFYLYWDRYLVSEYLPAAVILSALAIMAILPWLIRKRLAIVAAVVAGAIAIVPAAPSLILQSQDTYMAGAYDFTVDLIELQSDSVDPIVWSGTSENAVDGFFFQNTWMAFGLPIKRSFGFDVLNASQRRDNFAPDEVLTLEALEAYALCSPNRTLTVYETQSGGPSLDERLAGTDVALTPLGERTSSIALLAQPASDGWTHAEITVKAWSVTVPGTNDAECEAPRR
jgi:hypothetical protein